MEAAVAAASAAAEAAKEAALASSVAAAAAAKDAATAKEAVEAASVAAAAAVKDAATAKDAVAAASASALYAKEAAAAAAAAGEAAAAAVAAVAAAAMRASKKRKFHLVDDGQGPPGSEDADLISRLPDAILGTIVSLLPTMDGIRTQAVCRRWCPLWRSAPLNLELVQERRRNKGYPAIDSEETRIIPKILSKHPGPARRFSLNVGFIDCFDKVGRWLNSKALDNLQELELTYRGFFDHMQVWLPLSALRFAPTLRVAEFSGIDFPDSIMQLSLKFPCLKQLTLDQVAISEDALHSMLSGCASLESLELAYNCITVTDTLCISSQTLKFPCLKQLTVTGSNISEDALQSIFSGCLALESLLLMANYGITRLCISSQTLKCLGFSTGFNVGDVFFQELVIQDAPCLERLLPLDPGSGPATIRVISAPKLKILGMLSEDITELQFGDTVFQKMIPASFTNKMHTVRVLCLYSAGPNLDIVVNFLKCFPCLERLYVILQSQSGMGTNNVRKYDPLDPIECFELHLKEVLLKNYDGTKRPSIDFAKFFVLNAKVLKEMKITLPYHRLHDWFANQRRLLRVENRASRDARIELTCGSGTMEYFTRDSHIHDLSMADPFDMPSCGCSKCQANEKEITSTLMTI